MVAMVARGLHEFLVQLVLHLRLIVHTFIVSLVITCSTLSLDIITTTFFIPTRAIELDLTGVILGCCNQLRVVNLMSVFCG